jgi:hypothetical protein
LMRPTINARAASNLVDARFHNIAPDIAAMHGRKRPLHVAFRPRKLGCAP